MIKVTSRGSWLPTRRYLNNLDSTKIIETVLNRLGEKGVDALSMATPIDSSLTASSWRYEVEISKGASQITWLNSNVVKGVPIAIILQYGHGTGTGGYVQGQDYINPAIQPIFDEIADEVWKAVISA